MMIDCVQSGGVCNRNKKAGQDASKVPVVRVTTSLNLEKQSSVCSILKLALNKQETSLTWDIALLSLQAL